MTDPTQRFSNRVEDYVRYRPSYPAELIDVLAGAGILNPRHDVADVGSGTGKLSELFLECGNAVLGVEPNREMREAGDAILSGYSRFRSVDGRAEQTTLEDESVDIVAVGQAFHWFDADAARREFSRILRPGGAVVLVWNDRRTGASGFMRAYEDLLLKHGTDYKRVSHDSWIDEQVLASFFDASGFASKRLDHGQPLDLEGLQGRVASCSYVPGPGEPGHAELREAVAAVFRTYQLEGRVLLEYDTRLFYGAFVRE